MGSEIEKRDNIRNSLEKARGFFLRYYAGPSRFLRFLRYPAKSARRIIARQAGWRSAVPVATRTCWGKNIFVFLSDKNAGSLYYFGFLPKLEYPLSLYLARTLKENDVFYDAGANYGFYSVLADTLITKGEVHAFEPHPLLSKCLRKSLTNGVYVNEVALSDKTGEITFYDKYTLGHSGGSTILEAIGNSSEKGVSILTVATTTLDEYAKTHTPPTVIKIDVEGAERFVFLGGRCMLEKHHPLIAMEVWGKDSWEKYSRGAIDFLFKLGYVANEIGDDGSLIPISYPDLERLMLTRKYENIIFC